MGLNLITLHEYLDPIKFTIKIHWHTTYYKATLRHMDIRTMEQNRTPGNKLFTSGQMVFDKMQKPHNRERPNLRRERQPLQ